MFYGRQDDFDFAKRKIYTGDKNYVIVFCGERRSGKTSILFQMGSGQLGQQFLPVLIDLQTMAGLENDFDFFAEIAQEICRTLNHKDIDFDEYHFRALNDGPYKGFKFLLDKIFSIYPDKHLVLMIDEYEMLEQKFEDGNLSTDVVTFFAAMLEGKRRLSFIFTGSRPLNRRRKIEYWRVLFGKSLYRKIGFLSRADALRLIQEPMREFVTFADGIPETIYCLTAGQPFYTQVVCQNLIDYLNEHEKSLIEQKDIDTVAVDIVNNPLPQMIYIWNALNNMQKLAFAVLSEIQHDKVQYTPASKISRFLKHKGAGFFPGRKELAAALELLHEHELVAKRSESYRIQIPLLGRWVRQEHSFWKIVQELTSIAHPAKTKPSLLSRLSKAALLFSGMAVFVVAVIWGKNNFLTQNDEQRNVSISSNIGPSTSQPTREKTFIASSSEIPAITNKMSRPTKNEGPTLVASLTPQLSFITVFSYPPGANIFLNDSLVQGIVTPAKFDSLPPGNYTVRSEIAGYLSSEKDIFLDPGETEMIALNLLKQPPGYLSITAIPLANIYIDKVLRASRTINRVFEVEPGVYFIKLENSAYPKPYMTERTVTSSDTIKIFYDFRNH